MKIATEYKKFSGKSGLYYNYFPTFNDGVYVKVGKSLNLQRRMSEIGNRPGDFPKAIPGRYEFETLTHNLFKKIAICNSHNNVSGSELTEVYKDEDKLIEFFFNRTDKLSNTDYKNYINRIMSHSDSGDAYLKNTFRTIKLSDNKEFFENYFYYNAKDTRGIGKRAFHLKCLCDYYDKMTPNDLSLYLSHGGDRYVSLIKEFGVSECKKEEYDVSKLETKMTIGKCKDKFVSGRHYSKSLIEKIIQDALEDTIGTHVGVADLVREGILKEDTSKVFSYIAE